MPIARHVNFEIPTEHPYANQPELWDCTIQPPPLADPDDPHRLSRSHLQKIELGKSSGSCKVAFVTRLHRSTVLQEFWCASYEESQVYLNLAAHPDTVNFKEQLTRIDYVDDAGKDRHTIMDAHLLLRNSEEVLVSVKYDEKARRPSYLEEIRKIAEQCSTEIADRIVVASRYHFHPVYRECARLIHLARRGWDPEADRIVQEVADDLGDRFLLQDLVDRSGLGNRSRRAAIRLIGDGDLKKRLLDPIAPQSIIWRAAA